MIEKRASLLSRVVPDSETIYYDAIKDALDAVYLRLAKLQLGFTENSPDNTWTKKRLDVIVKELEKALSTANTKFSKALVSDVLKILQIDNTGAVEDFNAIINVGHTDDEPAYNYFKILPKYQIENLFKTDYITFTYLNASGIKKYSSISIQSMLESSALKTVEQVRSILIAGAINGRSPASIVSDMAPISKSARTNLRTAVRTLLADASNLADFKTLESNRDAFQYWQFIAVLDQRTSAICRTLDGKRWTEVPQMYQPPLHPNCRSRITPIPKGFKAGTRPLVLPDGTVKIIGGNLTYRDAVELYPQLENKSFVNLDKYEKLMLQ